MDKHNHHQDHKDHGDKDRGDKDHHQDDQHQDVQVDVRPYWIPAGVDFDALPMDLRAAITGLVNPAYRELVLKARAGLEQTTGMTIVHLVWLEILDQLELGRQFGLGEVGGEESTARERLIARHLRIIGAKSHMSGLVLRIHGFVQRWGAFPAKPDPLRTADADRPAHGGKA